VVELLPDRNRARLKTTCINQHGEEVLMARHGLKPPKERIIYDVATPSRSRSCGRRVPDVEPRAMSLFGRADRRASTADLHDYMKSPPFTLSSVP